MDTLAIDIETYSDVSLPDCGVHRYAASEQFEILLFAYSLNDEPTRIFDLASGEKIPDKIMEYLTDDSVIKTAYNAAFERNCINRFFGLSFKTGRMEMHACTGIHAVAPAVTGRRGGSLNLDKKKDVRGKRPHPLFSVCRASLPRQMVEGQGIFRPMHRRNGNCSRHTASVTWMWEKQIRE